MVVAPHTVDPSCLWTLKNPIFFLIATACALSLPSQPTSAWRHLVSPHAPRLLLPAAHPTADAAPLLGHPCRDAPYIMSSVGRGWGSGQAPALGSLTKSSFSEADDRLWEQQLELRKEVSPLS